MKENNFIIDIKRTAYCIAAAFGYAAAMNLLVVPADIYAGGLFGMCQVVRTLLVEALGLDIRIDIASIIYYAVNVPIFIYAWIKISRRFLLKSIITLTAMTLFMSLIPVQALLPDDRLASCVVGSLICGASSGIILRCGSSAGGFDIIGLLMLLKDPNNSVGKVSLAFNGILYAVCCLLFSVDVLIYSVIQAAVYAFTVDKTHTQNVIVEAKIITRQSGLIEPEIINKLQRGITKWKCIGSYTGREEYILCVLLSKYELPHLRALVRHYDPNAFIILNENVHVQGNFIKRI